MSSIRVVVKIPISIYPELVADLSKVQLRDRAERLRILALLGLRDVQRLPPPSVRESPAPEDVSKPDQRATATKLIQRLKGSL
jgi:hypothetical protein